MDQKAKAWCMTCGKNHPAKQRCLELVIAKRQEARAQRNETKLRRQSRPR